MLSMKTKAQCNTLVQHEKGKVCNYMYMFKLTNHMKNDLEEHLTKLWVTLKRRVIKDKVGTGTQLFLSPYSQKTNRDTAGIFF